jgi:hypothetical protein
MGNVSDICAGSQSVISDVPEAREALAGGEAELRSSAARTTGTAASIASE